MPNWLNNLIDSTIWPGAVVVIALLFRGTIKAAVKRVTAVRAKGAEILLHPDTEALLSDAQEIELPSDVNVRLRPSTDVENDVVSMPTSVYEGILLVLAMHGAPGDDDDFASRLARDLFFLLYREDSYPAEYISAEQMSRLAKMLTLLAELHALAEDQEKAIESTP